MPGKQSFSALVAIGAVWMVGARISVRLIGLVSTVILARLLTPEDFGLVGLAVQVLAIIEIMSNLSFSAALIKMQDADSDDYATAWTLNLLRGLAVFLLMMGLAFPLAWGLEEDRLVLLIICIAIIPLVDGLANVRFVEFEKQLNFTPVFLMMVSVKIATFAVTVTLAYLYQSYWALIAGSLTSNILRVVLQYVFLPYRPHFCLRSTRKLFSYSGWLMGANMVAGISSRLDYFILKRVLDLDTVGYFHMAREVATTPFTAVSMPLRRVLFPAFSTVSEDKANFLRLYAESVAIMASVLIPAGVGVALVAPDAVPLLLGEKWIRIVFAIQLISLLMGFHSISLFSSSLALASGRTKFIFWRAVIYAPVRPTVFFVGAYYWGFQGAIVGYVLAGVFWILIELVIVARILSVSPLRQTLWCWRSILSAIGMVAVVQWVQAAVGPGMELGEIVSRLAASIALGAISYVAVHFVLWAAGGRPPGPEVRVMRLLSTVWLRFARE